MLKEVCVGPFRSFPSSFSTLFHLTFPCVLVEQQQQKFCAKLFTCGDRITEHREEQAITTTKHAEESRDLFPRSMTKKQNKCRATEMETQSKRERRRKRNTKHNSTCSGLIFRCFFPASQEQCLCSSCSRLSRRLLVFLRAHRIVTSHVNSDLSIGKQFQMQIFFLCRTDGQESPILAESDADAHSDKPRSKYGELVILG